LGREIGDNPDLISLDDGAANQPSADIALEFIGGLDPGADEKSGRF